MTADSRRDDAGQSAHGDDHPSGKPRTRLEFHSDELAEPFREMLAEDVTIEVDSVVDIPGGTHFQYWTTTGSDVEALLETIRQFPTTREARLVRTVDGVHRIEARASPESVFSTFNDFDGETKRAVYDEAGVHVVAEFPPSVDPSAVVDAVHDIYPDLGLVSSQEVKTADVVYRLTEEHLTDRQLTALQMAYFGGYFEQPRASTGEELAERMGITKQAFHEHLRKAYSVVFEQLFAGDRAAGVDQ